MRGCLVFLAALAVGQHSETFTVKGPAVRAREEGMRAASEGRFVEALSLLERAARRAIGEFSSRRGAKAKEE